MQVRFRDDLELIKVFENVFDEDLCAKLIENCNFLKHTAARWDAAPYQIWIEKDNDYFEILKAIGEKHLSLYLDQFPIISIDNFHLSHGTYHYYDTTCKLGLHTDGEHVAQPKKHEDPMMGFTRTVGVLGFLNDDFDGGEIKFPLQEITYKPKRGDLLVFPFGYMFPHLVTRPSKERYSLRFDFWKYGLQ